MTTHETAAIPRPSTFQGGSSGAMPGASDAQTDMQLFHQLRFQIEGYVRKAARSYGLPDLPGDPAHVIEALRGSNLVDESDLRMAEGVLALSDRVIAEGRGEPARLPPGADALLCSITAATSPDALDETLRRYCLAQPPWPSRSWNSSAFTMAQSLASSIAGVLCVRCEPHRLAVVGSAISCTAHLSQSP